MWQMFVEALLCSIQLETLRNIYSLDKAAIQNMEECQIDLQSVLILPIAQFHKT